MLTLILTALKARYDRWQDRRSLRGLMEKDDRTLSDIGLTRQDIAAALSNPDIDDTRAEAFRLSRLAHRPFNSF
ncbi:MAG: DUF1127 domain-containing protein [Pseudomonadota bacterium]